MAENVIFAEQALSFEYSEGFGAHYAGLDLSPFSLVDGQEYIVVWDEEEYVRTAFAFTNPRDGSSCVALGNPLVTGGTANEDKFAIVEDKTNGYAYFFSTETTSSHKVSISQIIEEEEPETPIEPEEPEEVGIVIKDRLGDDVTYYGVETVTFDTNIEGRQQTYTKGVLMGGVDIDLDLENGDQAIIVPEGYLMKQATIKKPENLTPENIREGESIAGIEGTLPAYEVLENVPIDLDFSNGNQSMTVPDENVVKSAIIQRPETLIPENIAEGVDIAGIIGTLAAGGAKVEAGTFTGQNNVQTVAHSLGVTPDIIIFYTSSDNTKPSKGYVQFAVGISAAFASKYGSMNTLGLAKSTSGSAFFYNMSAYLYGNIDGNSDSAIITKANENSFTLGTSSYVMYQDFSYKWFAIGGLT